MRWVAFLFENLVVYQKALCWAAGIDKILKAGGIRRFDPIADQLTRAGLSIPLNIAEGNGRWHSLEKRRFFMIARGSALECVALLQVMQLKKLIDEKVYRESYSQLEEIAKMLTGLVKSLRVRK